MFGKSEFVEAFELPSELLSAVEGAVLEGIDKEWACVI